MSQTKYVMSGGLAFAEEKDMEKLRQFSLKGWHVTDFKFMGYVTEKGQSSDYIYSVDYRTLKEGEKEEYFDFFLSSGWSHISSSGEIHLFRAAPGTTPIYSDRESVAEKHQNLGSTSKWIALSSVLLAVLAWIGLYLSSGNIKNVFAVATFPLTIVAVPSAWTVMTIYKNKWMAEEKKALVNMARTIIPLFLLGCVLFLIFFNGTENSMRTLAYMIVASITFPPAIWCIMSLSQKWKGKRA
ncbi:DUF2812 domain-containing protein [Alkalicoccobacillus murimartini]|uniref:Cell division protein FtsB n=1 Tax=Alkalicoccobacillus murimartini TaxID=171685 RepID=A0ABT9YHU6_9BACI|nr:DUF2812 domain-containing protein [Alkalicoccobacillus murimartini]MDQ0207407.1 cell division protein FtsB [Alkalicoccobacillus murimartini]